MKDIILISDLHLMPERPQVMELFIRFSKEVAAKADALYILGDFLEVWWGDDDPATGYQGVFNALSELVSEHQTELFLMHGNRDFMIGEQLAERCHFKIIEDPHRLIFHDKELLLMHGDTLCTDDIEYQQFRQMVRNPLWQQQVLTKSLEERFQLAKSIRENSKQSTTGKDEYIMDVNQAETEKTFIENNINVIIHGHTHRPAIHLETISDKETTRIVLGDWHETGSYLHLNNTTDFKLQTYR